MSPLQAGSEINANKNKQTNKWETTKATTEAVYALLLQGSDWLSVTEMVDVKVGDETNSPETLENVKFEKYKTLDVRIRLQMQCESFENTYVFKFDNDISQVVLIENALLDALEIAHNV